MKVLFSLLYMHSESLYAFINITPAGLTLPSSLYANNLAFLILPYLYKNALGYVYNLSISG